MSDHTTFPILEPWIRSILRIVAGLLFMCHGLQKLFGFFGGMGGSGITAHFGSPLWVAAIIETLGGTLIILGLFTSPTAFFLSGEMAVAFFWVHFRRGFFPIQNGGELAVLYCFFYLYLIFAGGGPLSFDTIVRKK